MKDNLATKLTPTKNELCRLDSVAKGCGFRDLTTD